MNFPTDASSPCEAIASEPMSQASQYWRSAWLISKMLGMSGKDRKDIKPGLEVEVVLKQDQHSGKTTRGIVKDVLTKSAQHPHGIKVRLETGEVGRVKDIIGL